MTLLQTIAEMAKENKIFQRNRVPIEKKVLAALLCASGFTYRQASEIVGGLSYVAVHDAYIALKSALPRAQRKPRKIITIEEAKTSLSRQTVFVWGAKDLDANEVLLFRCSLSRSAEEAERFILDTLNFCENLPAFNVDGGPWDPRTFKKLHLKYEYLTIGIPRKLMMWLRDLFG